MRKVPKVLLAWLAAVIVGFLAASVLHTQFVLGRLAEVGAEIPAGVRLQTTLGDIVGFIPAYPAVIGIALAVGFAVAALLKRVLKPLAPYAHPIAGFVAVGTALALMKMQMEITPVAGARGAVGFLAQCLAGALAGWVFALLVNRRRADADAPSAAAAPRTPNPAAPSTPG
jgi:hypothetical protein